MGTEVLRSSRRNYQQARGIKLTLTSCSSMRERHKQSIVHGNGRSALRQWSNATTDHDTRRVRRRRQWYKHRGRRTYSAQSLTNHTGQSRRVDGYNIRVNLAIGPRWPVRGAVLDTLLTYRMRGGISTDGTDHNIDHEDDQKRKRKEGKRWATKTATQARRERRTRWHWVNDPGPPLHPEGDGSLCTGVVLPKATR